jgi:hypothetical protein
MTRSTLLGWKNRIFRVVAGSAANQRPFDRLRWSVSGEEDELAVGKPVGGENVPFPVNSYFLSNEYQFAIREPIISI